MTRMNELYQQSRDQVLAVQCPTCLASEGSICLGVLRPNKERRVRTSLHLDRYLEAASSLDNQSPVIGQEQR